MKVISWRNAIQKATLEPTTKLVLFNLSVHMNDAGESCFPSIELQCQYTGLSNRAVITHLKKAEEAGFITKSKHGYGDQRWARNEYVATFPPEAELDKAVNVVHDHSEKGSERRSEGSELDDKKVVNQVHTNSTNITLQEQDHSLGAHAPTQQKIVMTVKGESFSPATIEGSPSRVYSPIVNTGDVEYHMEKTVAIPLEVIGESKKGKVVYCKVSESQSEAQPTAPNTSKLPTQKKENTPHQVGKKVAVASIPEWLPKEEWEAFLEMRQKIKKPMTEHAKGLAIGKLAKLKEQGEDVVAVLEQSIMNSYQGLFPVQKPKGGNNGRDSKGGELSGIMQSFKNEFGTFNSFG